jgi:hypothetical protein
MGEVLLQGWLNVWRYGHRSQSRFGLRTPDHFLAIDPYHGSADMEHAGVEVDVGPAKREHFTEPEAAPRGQQHSGP